jgi:hypothetical protein
MVADAMELSGRMQRLRRARVDVKNNGRVHMCCSSKQPRPWPGLYIVPVMGPLVEDLHLASTTTSRTSTVDRRL